MSSCGQLLMFLLMKAIHIFAFVTILLMWRFQSKLSVYHPLITWGEGGKTYESFCHNENLSIIWDGPLCNYMFPVDIGHDKKINGESLVEQDQHRTKSYVLARQKHIIFWIWAAWETYTNVIFPGWSLDLQFSNYCIYIACSN